MRHGHDPRRVDDYPWEDVEAFLALYPDLMHPIGDLG